MDLHCFYVFKKLIYNNMIKYVFNKPKFHEYLNMYQFIFMRDAIVIFMFY